MNTETVKVYNLRNRELYTYLTYRSFLTSKKTVNDTVKGRFSALTARLFQSGIYGFLKKVEFDFLAHTRGHIRQFYYSHMDCFFDEFCENAVEDAFFDENDFLTIKHLIGFFKIITYIFLLTCLTCLAECFKLKYASSFLKCCPRAARAFRNVICSFVNQVKLKFQVWFKCFCFNF